MALVPVTEGVLSGVQAAEPFVYNVAKGANWYNTGRNLYGAFKKGQSIYRKAKDWVDMPSRKRTRRGALRSKRKTPNFTSSVKVARGGLKKTVHVSGKRKRRFKKSKSAKIIKRLRRLEKNQVAFSNYHFQNVRPASLSSAGCNLATAGFTLNANRKAIFRISSFYNTSSTLESRLSNVRSDDNASMDYGEAARNPKIAIKRTMTYKLKNSGLSAVSIKYVNYVCKGRTSKDAATELLEYAGDRGIGGWAYDAGKSKDANGSLVPAFIYGSTPDSTIEFLSMIDKVNHYKQVGTISKATLRPGDEVSLYAKNFCIYKAEEQDRDGHTFHPDYEFGLLIQIQGEIMHDDTLVTQIGYSDFHVDCVGRDNLMCSVDNQLGHNLIDNDAVDFAVSANGWTTSGPQVAQIGDGA